MRRRCMQCCAQGQRNICESWLLDLASICEAPELSDDLYARHPREALAGTCAEAAASWQKDGALILCATRLHMHAIVGQLLEN